ncbi:hypothetical protein [Salipaludibacillus sp. CF4.18]|uniref:hypothetical protein n=1 Tax=Salipaludibacillus sp. CF4.18 TaxID=3373081 RepID=UPI003EE56CB5
MSNLYGVHGGSSIYALVKAKSEQEAFNIFAKSQIDDETLREEIDSFIVNASLLEKFYRDEHGHFHDDYTGEYPERIQRMKEEDRENYVENHIEKNVRKFWESTPEHAETYIKELKKSWEEGNYHPSFSEYFYVETIKLIINEGNWYEDFAIVKIDMLEHDYQIIYKD